MKKEYLIGLIVIIAIIIIVVIILLPKGDKKMEIIAEKVTFLSSHSKDSEEE